MKNAKKIKHLLITLLLFAPLSVNAGIRDNQVGLSSNSNEITTVLPGNESSIVAIVMNIINIFLGFMGLLFAILIIIDGFRYMTDYEGKDTEKVKKHLFNMVIGLLLMVAAFSISWAITKLILGATTENQEVGGTRIAPKGVYEVINE